MYSLVMLMAMNGPIEAPANDGSAGCTGCVGNAACVGCTGCAGCSGCTGARHGFLGWRLGMHHACRGCTGCSGGACYGGGCRGGYGGACHGCHGGYGISHACGGCTGCYGVYGFAGCYGSCYGSYTNYFSYWTQPPTAYGYGMPMYAEPPAKIAPPPTPVPPTAPGKGPPEISTQSIGASVTVRLPADATLYANGVRTTQTSAQRSFMTPRLEAGQRYHYVFTAEMERDGKMVTETKKVEVWSGALVDVDFGA